MQENYIPLHRLPIGCTGRVRDLRAKDNMRRRMLDLGLISDTVVEALCQSPSGDPSAYQIRGAVIALRSEEASQILVEMV
ncbi:MAG TPA: ferrous iron transport protein A [Clostridia bacterium]|jgi:ferrous iron transport protein A|nr:ferrous iron transport protein A [Clostridia bacterium]